MRFSRVFIVFFYIIHQFSAVEKFKLENEVLTESLYAAIQKNAAMSVIAAIMYIDINTLIAFCKGAQALTSAYPPRVRY